MKKLFYFTLAALFIFTLFVVPSSNAWFGKKQSKWAYQGVETMQDNPDVKRYKWETQRPPNGPFDKISLYRVVKENYNRLMIPYKPAPDRRKVLFMIPGTWSRGKVKGTGSTLQTAVFLAKNGYDVYTMDFRTINLPDEYAYDQFATYGIDISSTADWTYGVFREDIKACVDKAKKISRAGKIFMAGRSRGGTQMFIYASKYADDLKGMISLDGGGKILPPSGTQITEEEYLATVQAFKAGLAGPLLAERTNPEQSVFGGLVPYSTNLVGSPLPTVPELPYGPPPDGSNIETIADYLAYSSYYVWGVGGVTNVYTPYPGGEGETYIDKIVLADILHSLTRYWPQIQNIEGSQTGAYSGTPGGCPFLDYDDNLADLPLIAFLGELFCPGGGCLYLPGNMTLSDDATFIYLEGYGHLDVYSGTHSIEDVKQPMLEWMNDRL